MPSPSVLELLELFKLYAAKHEFPYFIGGESRGNIVINYHDGSVSREKLVEILSDLSHDLPGLLGSDHDSRKKIPIKDFKRRFQPREKGALFFKKTINRDSPKKSFLFIEQDIANYGHIEYGSHVSTKYESIALKPWKFTSYYDGLSFYEPRSNDTAKSVVRRVQPETFEKLCRLGIDSADAFPSEISNIDFPIDAVYTWVDGDDERWQSSKRLHMSSISKVRVAQSNRYKSRNELLYSIRSLELNAPWINHIYIVTDRQCPDWLDLERSAERITIVDHSSIMEEVYRPCFNSSAIETFLHRIEGLSENFLYFNDDFLLGRPVEPQEFFLSNGVLKCFPSEQRALPFDIDLNSEEYIQADKLALQLISTKFIKSGNQLMKHAPYPSSKSLLSHLEVSYPEAYHRCRSNRFRAPGDLRPIAFMQYHYGFNMKSVIYSEIQSKYIRLSINNLQESLDKLLSKAKTGSRARPTAICLNDAGMSDDISVDTVVSRFLEEMYPFKLTYEKS